MRLIRTDEGCGTLCLSAGKLLLAHPFLRDRNFKRSVLLLTAYSEQTGALGVILNRALGQNLGEFDPHLKSTLLREVPLYLGGPVAVDRVILVAWKWSVAEASFKLYFGIDEERALEILKEDPAFQLRGFLGHAGWGEGQLEAEMEASSWVVAPLSPEVEAGQGDAVWRCLLSQTSPEMRLLAEAPEDPLMN